MRTCPLTTPALVLACSALSSTCPGVRQEGEAGGEELYTEEEPDAEATGAFSLRCVIYASVFLSALCVIYASVCLRCVIHASICPRCVIYASVFLRCVIYACVNANRMAERRASVAARAFRSAVCACVPTLLCAPSWFCMYVCMHAFTYIFVCI